MTVRDYELMFGKIVNKIKEDLSSKSNDISVTYDNDEYFYEISHENYKVRIKITNILYTIRPEYSVECDSKNKDGHTVVTLRNVYQQGSYSSSLYGVNRYDSNGTKIDSDYLELPYSLYIYHSIQRLTSLLDDDPRLKEVMV